MIPRSLYPNLISEGAAAATVSVLGGFKLREDWVPKRESEGDEEVG